MHDPANIERKLAAIFSADVAGYSRLMAEDEVATLQGLTAERELMTDLVRRYHGRVVDSPGDNLLAEFPSALDATRCAVEVQRALRQRNADLPPNRRMELRIGIHLGDVIVEGERIYGDGVNIAARLERLAAPGGICISRTVHEQVSKKLDVGYEDLGDQQVKNIPAPVRVLRVLLEPQASVPAPPREAEGPRRSYVRLGWLSLVALAVVAGAVVLAQHVWLKQQSSTPSAPQIVSTAAKKSIAVLPFVNMSSDKENEYFSDGVTEDLINALSKVSGLRVAARTSSFAFKGKNEDVRAIGTQLNVGAVLEGSVAKAGNQVRITAQLINTADGYHLWSDSYRELQDIFAVRTQVAETVAKALQVTLGTGEIRTLEQKPTDDLEAYQLYLRGRRALELLNDWPDALRYFQQAIARDPNYALAYLGLAEYYYWVADWTVASRDAMPRCREAAEKALQLDPSLAEGHTWLAIVHWWFDRDLEGARQEFQKALAMQADLATAHMWYGLYLTALGQSNEGLAESQRAVENDPFSVLTSTFLAANLYNAGRNDEAIQKSRAAVDIDPLFWWARVWLGRAYARAGRFQEAISELREAERLAPFAEVEAALGRTYADHGSREEATKVLNHLHEGMSVFVSPGYIAVVLIGIGKLEEAFAALEQAEEGRWYYGVFLKVDPYFDPLRSDPRFKALLKKARLEP
jgi:TolB-like protein/class 3 adenylate cyclase